MAMALSAHAPKDIEAKFDIETKILEITVNHPVKGDGHYVEKITVELNDEEIIQQQLNKQEDKEKQTVVYKITNAKSGDEIEVIADCNKFGKEKAKIEVK
ncbi:MAG: desulfoferrodoxin family protein [Candidatus Zixiibacteriota bacterium]